ncbi:MAG TPA: DUF2703 domain-containing protein [Acidimicrobiales bacterium]|nr:DUF2703 domain-containing protein [Acidimicrobiales bacterium]
MPAWCRPSSIPCLWSLCSALTRHPPAAVAPGAKVLSRPPGERKPRTGTVWGWSAGPTALLPPRPRTYPRVGRRGAGDVRALPIVWQRLVSQDGRTCDRCAATQDEVQHAVVVLEQVLRPLGIQPRLEISEIDEPSFKADPAESNRIWIAGRPMEDWIEGRVGSSRCCSVCGDSECRTLEVRGATFEAIPERLIIRAALIASSELLDDAEAAESA